MICIDSCVLRMASLSVCCSMDTPGGIRLGTGGGECMGEGMKFGGKGELMGCC